MQNEIQQLEIMHLKNKEHDGGKYIEYCALEKAIIE